VGLVLILSLQLDQCCHCSKIRVDTLGYWKHWTCLYQYTFGLVLDLWPLTTVFLVCVPGMLLDQANKN